MRTAYIKGLHRTVHIAVAVMLLTILPSAILSAEDFEWPYVGGSIGGTPEFAFGDLTVATPDVTGSSLDAKELVEPQLTVLLTMCEVVDSPSETVVVKTQPMVEIDGQAQ